MAIRPVLASGIALASAGAIIAATPSMLPTQQQTVTASVPAPLAAKKTLTVDQLRLLALTDITVQKLISAFVVGYGGNVPADSPYYPHDEEDDPILVKGIFGLQYYLAHEALDTVVQLDQPPISEIAEFANDNVLNYYFEVNELAAIHVALAELTGGPDTEFAALLEKIFKFGFILEPFLPTAQSATLVQASDLAQASDIVKPTLQDIVNAFGGGYPAEGPYVDEDDPYYPQEPTEVTGVTGVAYYLSDVLLYDIGQSGLPGVSGPADFLYQNVNSYLWEVSALAAVHVALAELAGGPDTQIGEILQRIFNPLPDEEEDPVEQNFQDRALNVAGLDAGAGILKTREKAVSQESVSAEPEDATDQDTTEAKVEVTAVKAKIKKPALGVVRNSDPFANAAETVDHVTDNVKKNIDKTSKNISDGLKKLGDNFGKKKDAAKDSASDDNAAKADNDGGGE